VFDPQGKTSQWLKQAGVSWQPVDAAADLSPYDLLIVGQAAMTADGPAPDINRVREGLKVLLFEQTAEVLEKRFGFRVAEYGLRQVFPRVPNHPALNGLATESLRDWRGAATILPPRLKYELSPRFNGAPTVRWCDLPVTRLWRCGNRGNVASVLIEKPARGDFLPILDGGFGLQYSPLMEYREGLGRVLFCQMDVTGRTESDPAAETIARNLINYITQCKPAASRTAVYAGEPAGKNHLEAAGVAAMPYEGKLVSNQVLIVGPRGGSQLADNTAGIAEWLAKGGHVLALGLDEAELRAFLPFKISMKKAEHIGTFFDPTALDSLLAGVGPADVHNRDPRELPLLADGAAIVGDGVLATATNGSVVFCQMAPWQFEPRQQANLKRTHRRVSFMVARLLGNLGVRGSSPILNRFNSPVSTVTPDKRWLDGLYFDQPEEWDDPYRFFRW
jgi:beta-galactosidase